jgi:tRNA 2-thiouridine synthesizing protein A
MTEPTDPIVVDARGHRCPAPTLRLRRALERAAAGRIVRLIADDPLARIDVPHFVRAEGFQLLSSVSDGDVLVFEVRRPGRRRPR